MRFNDGCMMCENVLRVYEFELLERLCDALNLPFIADEVFIIVGESIEFANATLFFRYDDEEFQSEQIKISIPVHVLTESGILLS